MAFVVGYYYYCLFFLAYKRVLIVRGRCVSQHGPPYAIARGKSLRIVLFCFVSFLLFFNLSTEITDTKINVSFV